VDEETIQKSLRISTWEGVIATIHTNLTTPFLVVFAIALGSTNFELGLIVGLQALFSLVGQVPAAKLVESFGNRKLVSAVTALISRIVWLPIALIPIYFLSNGFIYLAVFVSVSALFMSMSFPAWTSWMGDLVPTAKRGNYFSKRNIAMGIASLATLVFAGIVLGFFPADSFIAYGILFAFAAVLGIVCFVLLLRIFEPPYVRPEKIQGIKESFKEFFKNKNFQKFSIFFFFLNFALGLASPFWTAFVLVDLAAHPFWIAIISIALGIGMILPLKAWGAAADKFGNRAILLICSVGVAIFPFLYLYAPHPLFVAAYNLFVGLVWGGFNLAAFNYQLDITPSDKRAMYVALFATFVGLPRIFAPAIGGIVVDAIQGIAFFGLTSIQIIFLVSGILRFVSIVPLIGIDEPRGTKVSPKLVFREVVFMQQQFLQQESNFVILKTKSAVSIIAKPARAIIRGEIERISRIEENLRRLMRAENISAFERNVLENVRNRVLFERDKFRYFEKKVKKIRGKEKKSVFEEEFLENLLPRLVAERNKVTAIQNILQDLRQKKRKSIYE